MEVVSVEAGWRGIGARSPVGAVVAPVGRTASAASSRVQPHRRCSCRKGLQTHLRRVQSNTLHRWHYCLYPGCPDNRMRQGIRPLHSFVDVSIAVVVDFVASFDGSWIDRVIGIIAVGTVCYVASQGIAKCDGVVRIPEAIAVVSRYQVVRAEASILLSSPSISPSQSLSIPSQISRASGCISGSVSMQSPLSET